MQSIRHLEHFTKTLAQIKHNGWNIIQFFRLTTWYVNFDRMRFNSMQTLISTLVPIWFCFPAFQMCSLNQYRYQYRRHQLQNSSKWNLTPRIHLTNSESMTNIMNRQMCITHFLRIFYILVIRKVRKLKKKTLLLIGCFVLFFRLNSKDNFLHKTTEKTTGMEKIRTNKKLFATTLQSHCYRQPFAWWNFHVAQNMYYLHKL